MRTSIPAACVTLAALFGAPACGSDDSDDDLYFEFEATGGVTYPAPSTGGAPSSSTGGAPSSSSGNQSSECPSSLPDIAQPCTSPSTPCTYLGYSCFCDSTGSWVCSGIVSASVRGTDTVASSGTGGAQSTGSTASDGGTGTGGASSTEDPSVPTGSAGESNGTTSSTEGGTSSDPGTGGASQNEGGSTETSSVDDANLIDLCPRPAPSTGDSCPELSFALTCTYGGDLAPEGGTRSCECESQTWDCTDTTRGGTSWGFSGD